MQEDVGDRRPKILDPATKTRSSEPKGNVLTSRANSKVLDPTRLEPQALKTIEDMQVNRREQVWVKYLDVVLPASPEGLRFKALWAHGRFRVWESKVLNSRARRPEDCTQYILFLRFWWHHAASMTAPFGSLVSADPKELSVGFFPRACGSQGFVLWVSSSFS